jgi:hypothetical protein
MKGTWGGEDYLKSFLTKAAVEQTHRARWSHKPKNIMEIDRWIGRQR